MKTLRYTENEYVEATKKFGASSQMNSRTSTYPETKKATSLAESSTMIPSLNQEQSSLGQTSKAAP